MGSPTVTSATPERVDVRAATSYRILLVDDEIGVRLSLAEYLERAGFEVGVAEDGLRAMDLFAAEPYHLVLTDIGMPHMSGLDLLKQLKARDPEVEVIMITGFLDISFAIQAMRAGAYDFFTKPLHYDKIVLTIERARERQQLRRQAEQYLVVKKQKEFQEQAIVETALGFARVVEERDKFNVGHGQRTAVFSVMLGEALGLSAAALTDLRIAALLHDVGKIGIDDAILNKPGFLEPEEMAVMRTHSDLGDYILRPISFFANIRNAVRHHHERWDGTGYPDGLKGAEISLEARILCIADYFDSITSKRPYRAPMPFAEAETLMRGESGKHFDPEIIGVFLDLVSRSLGS